jgi:membrane-associated phospholipid phosphatase
VAIGVHKRESAWQAIRNALWSTDYMTLGMLILYTMLDIIFIKDVKSSFGILQINIMIIIGIIGFVLWYDQTGSKIAHVFRSFYILPVGYMLYAQVHNYIPLINPHNYDHVLAAWDRRIFGVEPTLWISRFANPVLTEYLQIWYNLFQLMLIPPAVYLYTANKMRQFRIYAMVLLFGFFLSYILYFIMPAIGPRFSVHDFYAIDRELPGLLLTGPLREFINAGNNITPDMTDPYRVVNKDCMPSGHTMMSVLGILMAWRYRTRWRWLITIGGTSVVITTVYLRYHYAVDVLAGLTLAMIVFAIHPWIIKAWEKMGIKV